MLVQVLPKMPIPTLGEKIIESGDTNPEWATRGKWNVCENWVRCCVELAIADLDGMGVKSHE